MTDLRFSLQMQYANAVFEATKYAREAELVREKLERLARETAEGELVNGDEKTQPVPSALSTAVEAARTLPNFSEIAREQGVTPGHVRRVFFGLTTSSRILQAIECKLACVSRGTDQSAGGQ